MNRMNQGHVSFLQYLIFLAGRGNKFYDPRFLVYHILPRTMHTAISEQRPINLLLYNIAIIIPGTCNKNARVELQHHIKRYIYIV